MTATDKRRAIRTGISKCTFLLRKTPPHSSRAMKDVCKLYCSDVGSSPNFDIEKALAQ